MYYWDLWLTLIIKELKLRYKNTVFGYLWSVANPLVAALVLFFAFRHALRLQGGEYYFAYLVSGMFPWQFFSTSMNQAPTVFVSNANLLKKVVFPRFMLILALVGQNLLHFMFALPILFFLLAVWGPPGFGLRWLWVLPLVMNQCLLIVGLVSLLGTLNLFFRDIGNLTMVALNLCLYATPVMYPLASMPEEVRWLLFVNPMTSVVELWHQGLLGPELQTGLLVFSLAYNCVILAAGVWLYRRWQGRFAEVV